jgi:hypothetical protein
MTVMIEEISPIPSEVSMVLALQAIGRPVGSKMYEFVCETIEKYPQYFQWEHTYKKIPQSVHDAYRDECYPKKEQATECAIEDGVGLMEYIRRRDAVTIVTKPLTMESFLDGFKALEKRDQERVIENNRRKKIWNKHYKAYGLVFRDYI